VAATREDLFARFEALGIETNTVEHEAFMTVEEAKAGRIAHHMPGGHCKTLFLKNKKGALFLLVALEDSAVNLKALGKALEAGRLSFGSPELLLETLGVTPGSVTPFALINDSELQVRVLLDRALLEAELVNFHPLENTATTAIQPGDLMAFMVKGGHTPEIWDLAELNEAS